MAKTDSGNTNLLGAFLRKCRIEKGFSLDEAAYRLNYDRSGIGKIENGQTKPRDKTLQDFFTLYSVNFDDFHRFQENTSKVELGTILLREMSYENIRNSYSKSFLSDLVFITSINAELEEQIGMISSSVAYSMTKARMIEEQVLGIIGETNQKISEIDQESDLAKAELLNMMQFSQGLWAVRSHISDLFRTQIVVSVLNPKNFERMLAVIIDIFKETEGSDP